MDDILSDSQGYFDFENLDLEFKGDIFSDRKPGTHISSNTPSSKFRRRDNKLPNVVIPDYRPDCSIVYSLGKAFHEGNKLSSSPQNKKKTLLTKRTKEISEFCEDGPQKGRCCTCKKSGCNKKYCECFSSGLGCNQACECFKCKNPLNKTIDKRLREKRSEKKQGCTCKKSGCVKKYCECFQEGKKCNKHCRCEGCKNCIKIVEDEGFISELRMRESETKDKSIICTAKMASTGKMNFKSFSLKKINNFSTNQ